MSRRALQLCGVIVGAAAVAGELRASTLYTSTSNGTADTLRIVDQATGQPTTVGPIGVTGARDMASDWRADSLRMWASSTDTGGDLYLVNRSGGSTLVGHMPTASPVRTLAFDVTTNRLFGSTYANELYQIDPATAAVTFVGAFGNVNGDTDSLAFDAQGVLWGTTISSPSRLVTFNPVTGAQSLKVVTNHMTFFSDIAFRPEDGVLFGISNGEGGQLYTINTTTGVSTRIGTTVGYGGTGLAFLTPEPSTLAWAALAAAVLRRQRGPGPTRRA